MMWREIWGWGRGLFADGGMVETVEPRVTEYQIMAAWRRMSPRKNPIMGKRVALSNGSEWVYYGDGVGWMEDLDKPTLER